MLGRTAGAIRKTPDAYTYLEPSEFPRLFAPDLPRAQVEMIAHSQVLAAAPVFATPLSAAAWKTKPSWGIVAGNEIRSSIRTSSAGTTPAPTPTSPSYRAPVMPSTNRGRARSQA